MVVNTLNNSLLTHLLFSVFDVLVLISTVRRDLLAGVHTILAGAAGLGHNGRSAQL